MSCRDASRVFLLRTINAVITVRLLFVFMQTLPSRPSLVTLSHHSCLVSDWSRTGTWAPQCPLFTSSTNISSKSRRAYLLIKEKDSKHILSSVTLGVGSSTALLALFMATCGYKKPWFITFVSEFASLSRPAREHVGAHRARDSVFPARSTCSRTSWWLLRSAPFLDFSSPPPAALRSRRR